MTNQMIQTDQAPAAIGPYAQAIQAGALLFVSGQLGLNPQNGELVSPDFAPQARQALENLKNIVEEAGGTLQNIVKKTTFLTHYSYIEAYRRVRSEYFPEPCPPNTLLIIESLALPDYMIEVEAIAVLD